MMVTLRHAEIVIRFFLVASTPFFNPDVGGCNSFRNVYEILPTYTSQMQGIFLCEYLADEKLQYQILNIVIKNAIPITGLAGL
jgi:hypothetical protein